MSPVQPPLPPLPPSPPSPTPIGGSFVLASEPPKRRLIVAVDGLEKEGKTNFALTAPGPIAYQGWDIGDEGVIEKFQTDKLVYRTDYGIDIPKDADQKKIMELMEPEWTRFLTDYKGSVLGGLKSGLIKTGIWDTGSEVWEGLRMTRLGKLTQVMPHHYVALNAEYRNLVRAIYDTPGNLVILHKLKAEWKENQATGKSNKTGNYERAGYSDTGFLVQVNVLAWREQDPVTGKKNGPFHVTIQSCRQNPKVVGLDLMTDVNAPGQFFPLEATFQCLALAVYPDTMPEDWA